MNLNCTNQIKNQFKLRAFKIPENLEYFYPFINDDNLEFNPRERIKLSYPVQKRIDMLRELIDG